MASIVFFPDGQVLSDDALTVVRSSVKQKGDCVPTVMRSTNNPKRHHLERLIADRKEILVGLSRIRVSESDPEEEQKRKLQQRRLVKAKLAAINLAIKAAGGRLHGAKAF